VIYFTVPVATDRYGFVNNEHTRSIIATRQKLMIPGNSFCNTLLGFVLAQATPLPVVALGPKCTVSGLAGSLPPADVSRFTRDSNAAYSRYTVSRDKLSPLWGSEGIKRFAA